MGTMHIFIIIHFRLFEMDVRCWLWMDLYWITCLG